MKKSDFALFCFSANFGNRIRPILEISKKDKNRRFLDKKNAFWKI